MGGKRSQWWLKYSARGLTEEVSALKTSVQKEWRVFQLRGTAWGKNDNNGICDSITNQKQQKPSPIEIEINLNQLLGVQLGVGWSKFNFF